MFCLIIIRPQRLLPPHHRVSRSLFRLTQTMTRALRLLVTPSLRSARMCPSSLPCLIATRPSRGSTVLPPSLSTRRCRPPLPHHRIPTLTTWIRRRRPSAQKTFRLRAVSAACAATAAAPASAMPPVVPPRRSAKTRCSAISAHTAPNRIPPTRACRSTSSSTVASTRMPPPRRNSNASTAIRNTTRWAPSRCTFAPTRYPASARSAAKRSPGRGYCRVTYARIPARSRSLVRTATGRSPIARTCALTFKRTPTWRSTRVPPVARPSRACRCSPSTRMEVARVWPVEWYASPTISSLSTWITRLSHWWGETSHSQIRLKYRILNKDLGQLDSMRYVYRVAKRLGDQVVILEIKFKFALDQLVAKL